MPIHESVETLSRSRINQGGTPASDGGGSGASKMAQEVVDARKKIFVQRTAEKGISEMFDERGDRPPAEPAIRMNMDVGGLITGLMTTLTTAHEQSQKALGEANTARESALATSLTTRIEGLQKSLDEAKEGNSVSTLLQTIEGIRKLESDLKAEMGGQPGAVQQADPIVAIKLKELDMEISDRDRKFQLQLEELKQQREQQHEEFLWQMKKFELEREDTKEDKKAQRDLEDRKMRYEAGEKAKRAETFNDFLSAAGSALDKAMSEGEAATGTESAGANLTPELGPRPEAQLEEFECQECHNKEMIDPNTKKYTCPKCNTVYEDKPAA